MKLQFVCAEASDIPLIYAQAKDLVDRYEDVESIDYDKVMGWVARKIENCICQYTCVIADGVRCAWYRLCEDGELDDLYVLPAFQCRGIGTQIMEKCICESEKSLWLYVFSRNIRAISFYQRFGFAQRQTVGETRLIMSRNS